MKNQIQEPFKIGDFKISYRESLNCLKVSILDLAFYLDNNSIRPLIDYLERYDDFIKPRDFKIGDMVSVGWFESSNDLAFVDDMKGLIGTKGRIQDIEVEKDFTYYKVLGWEWPESALTKVLK